MVQLDKPIGKNNGSIGDTVYTEPLLPSHTGALVPAKKCTKRTMEQDLLSAAAVAKRTVSTVSLQAPEGCASLDPLCPRRLLLLLPLLL